TKSIRTAAVKVLPISPSPDIAAWDSVALWTRHAGSKLRITALLQMPKSASMCEFMNKSLNCTVILVARVLNLFATPNNIRSTRRISAVLVAPQCSLEHLRAGAQNLPLLARTEGALRIAVNGDRVAL